MTWITINFFSNTLHMPVEAEILLPYPEQITNHQNPEKQNQKEQNKALILLHEIGHDRTEWLMKSQIYDIVKDLPILVCMPSGKNSFFTNTANGYHYMDYITKELPDLLKKMFYLSNNKEDWLIAGASTGGYSALLCGLHHPEQFGYLASFGGVLNIRKKEIDLPEEEVELIFGSDGETKEKENLLYLCDKVAKEARPHIMIICGKQDSLYKENQDFYQNIKETYKAAWIDGNGGHNFIYWNEHIKEVLEWFLREDRGKFYPC